MDIVFVVLHYLAIKDTFECVESIKGNIDVATYKIIVVDNASPDDSFQELQVKYSADDVVHLIHNEKNFGFARGNNVGFQFAKYKLNARYIVLLNNDTCIYQKNLYQILEQKYKEYSFAVLGPMILTNDGQYTTNPTRWSQVSREDCMNSLRAIKRNPVFNNNKLLGVLYPIARRLKRALKGFLLWDERKRDILAKNNALRFQDQIDVVLHGSFMVFSEQYVKEFDGLDDRTFMYFEEDILALQMSRQNMLMLYTPDIVIYHKEDASTNEINTSLKAQNNFKQKHLFDSMKIYMDMLCD